MASNGRRLLEGRIPTLARAVAPWGFPVVYLGWAFLFWAPIVGSDESVWSFPNVVLFAVGGLCPLLAGLLLTWLTRGRGGLRDHGRRLIDVGRIDPRWWLVVLLSWPAFTLVLAGAGLALGVTSDPLEGVSAARLFDPVAVVSLVGFAVLFPLVEEVGLRGYWLDELQERWSALVAGLINGTTWAIWHAPFVFLPGYYADTTFDPELSWWLPYLVLTALVYVWVYNNTNRSVLAVLSFHALQNVTGELIGFGPEMYPFVLAGLVAVAALLVAIWSPGSLRGWGRSRPGPWALPARTPTSGVPAAAFRAPSSHTLGRNVPGRVRFAHRRYPHTATTSSGIPTTTTSIIGSIAPSRTTSGAKLSVPCRTPTNTTLRVSSYITPSIVP